MADEVGLGLRGVAKLAEGERLLISGDGVRPKGPCPDGCGDRKASPCRQNIAQKRADAPIDRATAP